MAQLFQNNSYGSLGASLAIGSTSLTLATGHGARFPSPTGGDYFLLTLIGLDSNGIENSWEIVKVTGRSSDVLTIVRAQESTSAATWASGSRVELRATAGAFNSFLPLAGGTLTGSLNFNGIGLRITGDLSNGTIANRLMVQTSIANGNTYFSLLPNGTSTNSQLHIFGASDPTNAAYGAFTVNASTVQLQSTANGTGTVLPMRFLVGSTEFMRSSTAANLLIGTTTDDGVNKLQVNGSVAISGNTALHAGNYNAYAPTKTGAGASGSWGISVTGSAGSVAWSGVSGKPTTVSGYGITDAITTANIGSQSVNYAASSNYSTYVASRGNASGYVYTGRSVLTAGLYTYGTYSDPNAPATYFSAFGYGNGQAGSMEIGGSWISGGTGLWYRSLRDMTDSWSGWTRIIDSANIGSQSVASAGSVPWSGVTSKPTTIAGYGISDIGSQSVSYASTAGRAYPRRSDGGDLNFYWSGQSGQPTWLWGGTDGTNMYVYNPSNFSVAYASNAGTLGGVGAGSLSVNYANHAGTVDTAPTPNPNTDIGGIMVCYVNAAISGYPQSSVAGSNLYGTNVSNNSMLYGPLSGTWKALSTYNNGWTGLFMRIA